MRLQRLHLFFGQNPLRPWPYFLRMGLFHLGLMFLLRLAFALSFSDHMKAPLAQQLYAFYLGAKFDFRPMALLVLPALVHFMLAPRSFNQARVQKFWAAVVALQWGAILAFYFLDFGHYAYLHSRVSGAVIKFLENPLISAQMVWESYPVIWVGIAVAVFTLAMFVALRKWIFLPLQVSHGKRRSVESVVLILAMALGLYGKLAAYPLRWSEAFFTPHPGLVQLALNPLMYFAETYTFRSVDFEESKAREYYADLVPFLGIQDPDIESLSYVRHERPAGKIPTKANVVILVMESMAAFKSGLFGCSLNATPELDQLAKESQLWRKFYVPTIATARSLFATVTGLADVTMVKSSSRNPLVVEQNVPMNYLPDYEKFYFLGGSSNWGNVRGLFSYNVPGVQIIDEAQLNGPRTDVWGLSDFELFKEANQRLKTRSGPFVAIIQSSGYHRPYTIPEERGSFSLKELKEEQLDECDFHGNEEYNSLRFQDYALGEFFRLAKREKYYENTLFFIFGDHGLLVSRAKNVTEGQRILAMESYHVPLLIHAPRFFPPEVKDTIASQLDLWPTIMGLLGRSYSYRGPGRDLFDPRFDGQRGAFTFGWFENPPQLGFFDEEFYFFRNTNGKESLHRYEAANSLEDVSTQYPQRFEKLRRRTLGLYEMGRYLLYHNPHLKGPP